MQQEQHDSPMRSRGFRHGDEFVCNVCNAFCVDEHDCSDMHVTIPLDAVLDSERWDGCKLTMYDHYIMCHFERFWNSAVSIRNIQTGEVHSTDACADYQDGADHDCCRMAMRMIDGGHIEDWEDLQNCWEFLKSTKSKTGVLLKDDDMQFILDNSNAWRFVQPSPSTPFNVSPSASTVPCSPLSSASTSPPATVLKRR